MIICFSHSKDFWLSSYKPCSSIFMNIIIIYKILFIITSFFLWQSEHHRSHLIPLAWEWGQFSDGNSHCCILIWGNYKWLLSLSLSPDPSHTVPLLHLPSHINTPVTHSLVIVRGIISLFVGSIHILLGFNFWSSGPLLSTILTACIEVSNVKYCFSDKLFSHST